MPYPGYWPRLGLVTRSLTAPQPVQQRDRLLHHPAVHAQARAMFRAAPGDHRGDALVPDLLASLAGHDRPGSARFGPPFSARTCELSITAPDQSSIPAAFSPASSTSCSRCQTPAWCQSRSRRQHVIPRPGAHLLRQDLPPDPGVQDQQDPAQHLVVISRLRPG